MRITVVTTSYPAYEGDPAGHFVQAEVHELEQAGHEVTVVRPAPGGAFGWPGAAARLREKPHRALEAAAWVARGALELARARPDAVVAHWAVPSAWPVAIATSSSARLEIVSHGGDVRLLRALPQRARTAIVSRLVRRAWSWRFVSHELLAELAAVLPQDLAERLAAIATVKPSTLGMPDVAEAARGRRAALGGRPLYVCAGRLVASKRIDKVIDYVATARASDPVLVILGDGPQRAQLERVAERWQLDVRFLGTAPREEALSWIGAADEVVHASEVEGLSTVVREAEHLGVKVTRL